MRHHGAAHREGERGDGLELSAARSAFAALGARVDTTDIEALLAQ